MSYIFNRVSTVIPIGGIATLTGDSGGAVSPTGGNVNIVGGTNITVDGNPGTSTLTITATADKDYNVTSVSTTPYVALSTDQVLSVDSTAAPITIELPDAPGTGRWYTIKDSAGTAAANNITITTVGGVVLIDASATFAMNTAYQSATVVFNGTKYLII
jgi:hypothetical protein